VRVAVVGTGGLSHQLNGERFGHLNPRWDEEWLDRIENDAESLARLSHKEVMEAAGAEGGEVIMWLIMRGALSRNVRRVHRNYYAPMTTGMALLTLQDVE